MPSRTLNELEPHPFSSMAILKLSMSPESAGRIYDLLVCLSRLGETVLIEARSDKLTFTALNLSKTAYASFGLDAKSFFTSYDFNGAAVERSDRFTCQILNKALQSVFKSRNNDFRGRDTAVDRCDLTIQDQPDKTQCRLIVKLLCKNGLTKSHRLTYESAEAMHALFDKTAATQGWRIAARILLEYVEFFGPNTEQLNLVATEGKAVFTSFTEKIQDGKDVLKQPLETAVSIHAEDFEDFHMQEDMHIVISVRDFKAIVTHAETMKGTISASYSYPSKPLQFTYQNFGIQAEFTLMTTGDFRGASGTPNPKYISIRANSRQPSVAPFPTPRNAMSEMPPPTRPVTNKPLRSQSQRASFSGANQPLTSRIAPDPESLFIPENTQDPSWDPPNYETNEEEEMLGWNDSNNHSATSLRPTFRDSGATAKLPTVQIANEAQNPDELGPTQRLSQLHGLFD